MKNNANSYRVLMERGDYRKLIAFLTEDIERLLEIPPSKRTKKTKQLLEYSRRLLSVAKSRKLDFTIINKMAQL